MTTEGADDDDWELYGLDEIVCESVGQAPGSHTPDYLAWTDNALREAQPMAKPDWAIRIPILLGGWFASTLLASFVMGMMSEDGLMELFFLLSVFLAGVGVRWYSAREDVEIRASRLRAAMFSGKPARLRHSPWQSQKIIASISHQDESCLYFRVMEAPDVCAPIHPVRPNDVIETPDGRVWRVHDVTVEHAGDCTTAAVACVTPESDLAEGLHEDRIGRGSRRQDGSIDYGPVEGYALRIADTPIGHFRYYWKPIRGGVR